MEAGRWGDPLPGVDAAIQPDARLPDATALLTLTEVQDINTATLVGGAQAVLGDDVRMCGHKPVHPLPDLGQVDLFRVVIYLHWELVYLFEAECEKRQKRWKRRK